MINANATNHRYLHYFIGLYVTIALITVAVIYKLVAFHGYTISAATFVIPFWYVISDLIAEVYGYSIAKQLIWIGLFAEFVFIFSVCSMIHLPSPHSFTMQPAFDAIFSKLPRVFVGSFFAILLGVYFNIYVLTRLRSFFSGNYFWVRSVIAGSLGELIFTVVAFVIEFHGIVSISVLIELITISYLVKAICLPIVATPMVLLANFVKKRENIVVTNVTHLSPFDFMKEKKNAN